MNLDEHLLRIGALPVPDLTNVDGADLAARARISARQSRMVTGSVLVAALAIGISLQPAQRSEASLVPFGPPVALTPLALLG